MMNAAAGMSVERTSANSRPLLVSIYVLAGLFTIALFHFDGLPPLNVMICLLSIVTACGLATIRLTPLSLLPRLMVMLYVLPFTATLGYLFDDNYVWWETFVASQLCQDHILMAQMLAVGLVGLFGLLTGIELGATIFHRRETKSPVAGRGHCVLGLALFLPLTIVAVVLSWLSAPSDTILVTAYASQDQSATAAETLNFNSAFLISYILLLMLLIDAERDSTQGKRLKMTLVVLASSYIIIVLQLMRGDRESSGLIAAFAALYLTNGPTTSLSLRISAALRKRLMKLAFPAATVFVLLLLVGVVRSWSSDESLGPTGLAEIAQELLTQNTWTAVALTNLGLAEEIRYQQVEYLFGETYVGYLLSLPPGIISNALGYTRPLEANQGPAWWYSHLTAGGIHAVIVPFKNFGMMGVFGVLGLFGMFLSYCEVHNAGHFWQRLLYGTVFTCAMLWFWYGDMTAIRGVLCALVLSWIYRMSAYRRPRSTVIWTAAPRLKTAG